jgi:hypothetical protein
MTDERILEILDAHCLKGNCEADTRALVAAIKDILSEAASPPVQPIT